MNASDPRVSSQQDIHSFECERCTPPECHAPEWMALLLVIEQAIVLIDNEFYDTATYALSAALNLYGKAKGGAA
jgi:hypothetical protein